MALLLSIITALSFMICIAFAFDPSPLQDFCVADFTSMAGLNGLQCKDPAKKDPTTVNVKVRVNGLPCKNPATVEVGDFLFRGLNQPSSVKSSPFAFRPVDVNTLPGLNTLGLSLARFDIAVNGTILPHYHPRATEIIWVDSGSVEAGFVSNGKQYNKILQVGDVYVFPDALVHYFHNVAKSKSVVMAAFNSQNPGFDVFPNKNFGA